MFPTAAARTPFRTAAWRRGLSSDSDDSWCTAVGAVHPRRTAAERLEYLRFALQKNLPVFPLAGTVVFPGADCPLYIFEPRYRVLVQRSLRNDAHRCFGICSPASPGARNFVGSVVEITHNHWNEDGSASIVTRGLCRFSATTSAMATNAFGYHELSGGAAEVRARAIRACARTTKLVEDIWGFDFSLAADLDGRRR